MLRLDLEFQFQAATAEISLAALPEPQREVVVLKHLRDWSLQRIADQIGRTVPAVASLLRRGLEALGYRLAHEE